MNRIWTMFRNHFDSIASLGMRVASVLLGFGITFYIGHTLGPVANGQYALVTQTAIFLSVVAVGGIDLALVREFSGSVAKKVKLDRATLVRTTLASLVPVAIIIIALLIGGEPLIRLMKDEPLPEHAIPILCVMLVARALTRLLGAVLRSQKSYLMGQAVEVIFIPAPVLLAIALGAVTTVQGIIVLTAATGIAASLIGWFGSLRHTSRDETCHAVSLTTLLKMAVPMWGVALSLNFAEWYSLVTSASVLGVRDAGLYRVALQVASVLGIVSMGLFGVFTAKISAAHAAHDKAGVARQSRNATWMSALFVTPAALLLLVFSEQVLGLFGEEFVTSADTLRIMLAGQALFTITGISGLTLALTGNQRVSLYLSIIGTLFLLVAAPLATIHYGLNGLAVTVALLTIGRNVASVLIVRRLTGINVINGHVR
jgi:O-antigen/teichoic acid export membrane protein